MINLFFIYTDDDQAINIFIMSEEHTATQIVDTLKTQKALLQLDYPPLHVLLFNPTGSCLQSLQELSNIPSNIKQQIMRFPKMLRSRIAYRIMTQFNNHESWDQSLESYFASSLKQLRNLFPFDLLNMKAKCFIPKMSSLRALYDILDIELKVEAINTHKEKKEDDEILKTFFNKIVEVSAPDVGDDESNEWKKFNQLSANQKIQIRLRTMNKLQQYQDWQDEDDWGDPVNLFEAEKKAYYTLLQTMQEPWLLNLLLFKSSNDNRKIIERVLMQQLVKVENQVGLAVDDQKVVNVKLINYETIKACIKVHSFSDSNVTAFSKGCYLEDENKLYLKYSIGQSDQIFEHRFLEYRNRRNREQSSQEMKVNLKNIFTIIDRVISKYQVYVYRSFGTFQEVKDDKLFNLFEKLIICLYLTINIFESIGPQNQLKDICFSEENWAIFIKIIAFTEEYSFKEREKVMESIFKILRFLVQNNQEKITLLLQPKFQSKFISYVNKCMQEGSILPKNLNIFLGIFIPKMIVLGFDTSALLLTELYDLKWKTIVVQSQISAQEHQASKRTNNDDFRSRTRQGHQLDKNSENITSFLKNFPDSLEYFSRKLHEIEIVRRNLSKLSVFETKRVCELNSIVKIFVEQTIQVEENIQHEMISLIKDFAYLISEKGQVDWVKVAKKLDLKITDEMSKEEQSLLNLLRNDNILCRIEAYELCQQEDSINEDLVSFIKQLSYVRLLWTMNNGKFIDKESLKRQLKIQLQILRIGSIARQRIVQYQCKYSSQKLKEVKGLFLTLKHQATFSALFQKINRIFGDFNASYWALLAKYTLVEINQVLICFDQVFKCMLSGEKGSEIMSYIKKFIMNLVNLAQAKSSTNLSFQLYSHHKELIIRTLTHLWKKFERVEQYDENGENNRTPLGRAFLQFIKECHSQQKDPLVSYENSLKYELSNQINNLFRKILSENYYFRSHLLNDTVFKGPFNLKVVYTSFFCDIFSYMESSIPESLSLAQNLLEKGFRQLKNVSRPHDPQNDEFIEEERIVIQNMQVSMTPVQIIEKGEINAVLEEKKSFMMKKLFNFRHSETQQEKISVLFLLLLKNTEQKQCKALKSECIETLITDLIEDIDAKSTKGEKFELQIAWMDELMSDVTDITELACFSSTFVQKELQFILFLTENPQQYKERMDSSLSTLEKLIPCNIEGCNEAKTYLHILLQLIVKIAQTLGSSLSNNDSLLLIMQKLIKVGDPEFEVYLFSILKSSKNVDFTSFFHLLLDKDSLMSMEADTKGYFLKEQENKGEESSNMIQSPLKCFIDYFKDKYQHSTLDFSNLVGKLAHKQLREQKGKKTAYLVYEKRNRLDYSQTINSQFVNWKPPTLFRQAISQILQFGQVSTEEMSSKLELLRNIIYYHPCTLPFIIFHPITQGELSVPLIDYLVDKIFNTLQRSVYQFLFFVCLDHSCLLQNKQRTIFFAECIIQRILKRLMKQEITGKSLLFLFNMIQLKRFNRFLAIKGKDQQSMVDKLIDYIKSGREGLNRTKVCVILAQMILSVFYKQDEIEKLKDLYTPLSGQDTNRRSYHNNRRQIMPKHDNRLLDSCQIYFRQIYLTSMGLNKRNEFVTVNQNKENTSNLPLQILDSEQAALQIQTKLTGLYSLAQGSEKINILNPLLLKDLNLAEIIKRFQSLKIKQKEVDYNSITVSHRNYSHIQIAQKLNQIINVVQKDPKDDKNVFEYHRSRRYRRGYGDREDNNEGNSQLADLPDIEQQLNMSLDSNNSLRNTESQYQHQFKIEEFHLSRQQELEKLIKGINSMQLLLNQDFASLQQVKGKSYEESKQYLQRKLLETEFDFNQRSMAPEEFQSYLCSKSHQLEVISEDRKKKRQMAENKLFALNMQRTVSSTSTNYLIDVMDENILNLQAAKRGFSQQRSFSQDLEVQKEQNFHFEKKTLSPEHFSSIREDLFFQILMGLYYDYQLNSYDYIAPFIENKLTQDKVINTLLYIMRNPFNNEYFPKQLYKYDRKMQVEVVKLEGGEEKSTKSLLINRISKLIQTVKEFSYYENPGFLIEQIGLQGLNGIILKPNEKYTSSCQKDKHVPFFEILAILFQDKSPFIFQLLKDIRTLPQTLQDNLFEILISTDEELIKKGEENIDYNSRRRGRRRPGDNLPNTKIFENIRCLYQNEEFIRRYRKVYPFGEKQPNISFITALIGTPVYSKQQMQAIHLQVLNSKRSTRQAFTFLNKVIDIYSDDELKEDWLGNHKQVLQSVIKHLCREEANIQKEPIHRVFKFPHLVTFEMKNELMRFEIEKDNQQRREDYDQDGSRQYFMVEKKKGVFQSTFESLKNMPPFFWRNHVSVEFKDQQGKRLSGGGPGVVKQWYSLVTQGMVNLNYGLFMKTPLNFYYFNRQSHINPRHLEYFEFIGKLFARSITDATHFVCPSFSRILYKLILSLPIEIQDLIVEKFQEGEFYKQMSIIQQLGSDEQFEDLGITGMKFTYTDKRLIADRNYQLVKNIQEGKLEIKGLKENSKLFLKEELVKVIDPNTKDTERMGLAEVPKINISVLNVGEVVELLPGGANVEVNFSNRLEYLRLLREKIIENITKQVDRQFQQFLKGLTVVVNPKLLKRFTADELRDIVQGASHISVENLRQNIILEGYTQKDQIVEWFFDILSHMAAEDLIHFIHYWTGEPKIMREGFKQMRMMINRSPNNSFRVQTCYNTLYLPNFHKKDLLQEMIITAVESIKQGVAHIEDN